MLKFIVSGIVYLEKQTQDCKLEHDFSVSFFIDISASPNKIHAFVYIYICIEYLQKSFLPWAILKKTMKIFEDVDYSKIYCNFHI